MQELQRINIKFYLEDADGLSAEEAFRIFSTWIPQTSDEVLIDVADYSHVGEGPATLLVGHSANYSLDIDASGTGLLYARKGAHAGDLSARLSGAIQATLNACRRLETDPELKETRFRGGDLQIVANDRLHAPNTDEAEQELRAALAPVLEKLFAGAAYEVKRNPAEGERLNLRIQTQDSFAAQNLLDNLAA
jgi:hypothetical protein